MVTPSYAVSPYGAMPTSTGVFVSPTSGLPTGVRASIWGSTSPSNYSPYVSTTPAYTLPGAPAGGSGGGGGGFRGFNFNVGGVGTGDQQSGDRPIDWNELLEASTRPYGALSEQLRALTEAERQRIQSATSSAATFLGETDPMARYRETYRALEAPTASAASYLGAIGANPAQVEAQRNLANQLMAQQAAGQQTFSGAVDQANQNYRLAQLAEAYANQQRGMIGLESASSAQQAAIQMAATQQRNEVAKMMLEAQLRLLEIQAQQGQVNPFRGQFQINPQSLGF